MLTRQRFVCVQLDLLSGRQLSGRYLFLAMFNYVGGVWQDYEFVRDLTYWLSIRGRTEEFIYGLICSEDSALFPYRDFLVPDMDPFTG